MLQKENTLIRFIAFFLLATMCMTVLGQNQPTGNLNSDEMILKAKDAAYNNRKAESRQICRQILSRDSTYYDAAVLIGRTYSWEQKFDSAKIVLQRVLMFIPGHYDAIEALIDNELYRQNYSDAQKYADLGLTFHPNTSAFLFKKARAINNSGNSTEASTLLNQILSTDPSNKEAADLLQKIRNNAMINKIRLNYWSDYFSDRDSWQFFSASIGRKTEKFGTIILRYNYAARFARNGHQIEIDAYPSLGKSVYLYFNAGISNASNFPISRLSLEPYFKLPHSFEFSIGLRYMNFDKSHLLATDSSMVIIYTGTLGKYFGNYWISLRPYLVPGNKAWSKSLNLTIRRYLKDADNYLSLVLGSGISPDIQQYAFDPNYYLKSNKISLEYRKKLGNHFFLDLGTGFAREEIFSGIRHNKYTIDLGISYLF